MADVWLRAWRATYIFPPAHPDDSVRQYFATAVVPTRDAWVAEVRGDIVALMALHGEWIEQLYVDPPAIGIGVGTALLGVAKARRPAGLTLWTFQVNARARRFYEARGFVVAELTDGSGNQERQPDVRYVWTPAPSLR